MRREFYCPLVCADSRRYSKALPRGKKWKGPDKMKKTTDYTDFTDLTDLTTAVFNRRSSDRHLCYP